MSADPNLHHRFEIRQRFRLMVNQYEVVTAADGDATAGEAVCFVEQRRMKLKEELNAFRDDSKAERVFTIKAQQRWDPRATYDVTDELGGRIGQLKKVFGRSMLRSTWEIADADGEKIGWAQESSAGVAILRRISGLLAMVPLVGIVFEFLPIPYHFRYYLGDEPIGELRRVWAIRDRYLLDLAEDSARRLDRRVAIALAVGMDAMQAR